MFKSKTHPKLILSNKLQVVPYLDSKEMVSVMIKTIMKLAFLMVETAVGLMSIKITALNAYALMEV